MKLKALAAAILLSTSLLPHAQAVVVSTASSGIISDGLDSLALFGTAGADLTGLHYQMTLSVDIGANTGVFDDSFYSQVYSYGGAPVTYSVTVNNQTISGTASLSTWNQQYISTGRTDNNAYNGADQIQGDGSGYGADSASYMYGNHYIYSNTNAFEGITRDLLSSVTRELQSGDYGGAYFYLADFTKGAYTSFNAIPEVLSLNGSSNVPEPATLGIFALGLAGLAASRRKRTQA